MRRLTVGLLLGILLLTGCDRHAEAFARPAGEPLDRVRIATIDVVLAAGYAILEAPECREKDGSVTCEGTTVDGLEIASTSPRDDRDSVMVTVDGTKLYDGGVREVIERAARPS